MATAARRRSGSAPIRRRSVAVALMAVSLAAPGGAAWAASPADTGPDESFDVRSPRAAPALPPTEGRLMAAARLQEDLGDEGIVEFDERSGLVTRIARLDGFLTGPQSGSAVQVARAYVNDRRGLLGADRDDIADVERAVVTPFPEGGSEVVFAQTSREVPAFDQEVRVTVDDDGRVAELTSSLIPDLEVASAKPRLSARSAYARAMREERVGGGAPRVRGGSSGSTVRFANGAVAELTLFAQSRRAQLAWRLRWPAGDDERRYEEVVDATTGRVLHRVNLTDDLADATSAGPPPAAPVGTAFDYFPNAQTSLAGFFGGSMRHMGARSGGIAQDRSLARWLDPDLAARMRSGLFGWLFGDRFERTIAGNRAIAWSDINGNGSLELSTSTRQVGGQRITLRERLRPTSGTGRTGNYQYQLQQVQSPSGRCQAFGCTWNRDDAFSWYANSETRVTQAYYVVNRVLDWFAAAPIGFGPSSRNFQIENGTASGKDRDPVLVLVDYGADPRGISATRGLPKDSTSASMQTQPDGEPGIMRLPLAISGRDPTSGSPQASDVAWGEDASVVAHELTHGLHDRLLVDSSGKGGLEYTANGRAIGEGMADWFAMDYLVDNGFVEDRRDVPGEVVVGLYANRPRGVRRQGLDCPRRNSAFPGCGNQVSGFTLRDLSGKESTVHADGEIWSQTLWDLRQSFVEARPEGARTLRGLVAGALRRCRPGASFLDMRDCLLLTDQALNKGANRLRIWRAFAGRGMGHGAAIANNGSTATSGIVESSALPPSVMGTIQGRVSTPNGQPRAGAVVYLSGGSAAVGAFAARTERDGRYEIKRVPPGNYLVNVLAEGGYRSRARHGQAVFVRPGTVNAGPQTVERDFALANGGGAIDGTDTSATCKVSNLIRETIDGGWAVREGADVARRTVTITLPGNGPNVGRIVVDTRAPAAGCRASSPPRSYRISVAAADGDFRPLVDTRGAEDDDGEHVLGGDLGRGVRRVRVTLDGDASGTDPIGIRSISVFGAAAG